MSIRFRSATRGIPGARLRRFRRSRSLSTYPKELEVEEIIEIEDKFADAAERVKKAGFDGVEVHGAHGYLAWAFLTPLKNKRTDEYGGSLKNRFRFYREILEKVRARVGRDFVVGTRIISSDMYPGGMDVEDSARIAKMIEATNTVDFINVSIGMYRSVSMMVPSHYSGFEPGYQGEFTRKIKAEIKTLPVFQVGKINDPALAEHIIAQGGADAVMMIRELIAEPHFARKALEGRNRRASPVHVLQPEVRGAHLHAGRARRMQRQSRRPPKNSAGAAPSLRLARPARRRC